MIEVNRTKIYPSVSRSGPAWKWVYDCTGPDGRRWDGDSIVDLRDRLRRAYPGVEIAEPWKPVHRCEQPLDCSTCLNEAAAKSTARRTAAKRARATSKAQEALAKGSTVDPRRCPASGTSAGVSSRRVGPDRIICPTCGRIVSSHRITGTIARHNQDARR